MPTKIEKDAHSGTDTTGHEWDGVKELNTPLPKWWLYTFVACVVWAIGFMILYPSLPLGRTYFAGLLGYSQRTQVEHELAEVHAVHAKAMDQIAATDIAEVARNPELKTMALAAGRTVFANNCQPCHGPSGSGRVGYPILADDDWLWGGKLEDLQRTITYGIRSGHPEARDSAMPKFGADGILQPKQIEQVADFVLSLSGHAPAGADVKPGAAIFAENCAACHGDKGEGNREFGAPKLSDSIWLYGGDRASIIRQITNPRQGVMPAWTGRLDEATIKSLALYVHAFGGGE